jgi:tryptophan synthase beta chain
VQTKILLPDSQIPKRWYNVAADLPHAPEPILHPQTLAPVAPEDLLPIFPRAVIEQEVSRERWIDIPEEVLKVYQLWRPSPLYRAHRLEAALRTPARIYYKYEGVSPAGSHKPNTAIPQAFYNQQAGIKRLATETGAGQWGCSLALANAYFGLETTVYMVRVSYGQKPYRKNLMELWGAQVVPSPSRLTEVGRRMLDKDPDTPGSLGMAISEAVEDAASHDDTNYALGSVLNHVCLHQTVIGLEAIEQLKLVDDYPDVVIGCCGGGSNLAGLAFPFVRDKIHGRQIRLLAVEPTSCPTLTKGSYAFDYGDTAKLTPVTRMYTLGHDFVPPGIHAGGLRYHGASAQVSQLRHEGILEAVALPQSACFEAAVQFARTEGIVPAPESSHAIRAAIDEAVKAREEGRQRTILFNLSGHGHFDMAAYEAYLGRQLEDFEYPEESIAASLANLPEIG